MALKYRLQSSSEIPAGLVNLYVERDGAFVLDVEGVAAKSVVDEFRNNNIALKQQLADVQKRFEGIDPDVARAALDAKRKLDEGELLKRGDVDTILQPRLAPVLKRATDAETALAAANARLVELQVNQAALAAAGKRGLRPTAAPDLAQRARQVFKLVEGKVVGFEADGQTPKVGKDGVTPLSIDAWVDGLVTDAPHLFETNSGGGAVGSSAGGVGGVKNPWAKATWNLTDQMTITRTDPKRAEQLKASVAGV
jgi:hypothetical protein